MSSDHRLVPRLSLLAVGLLLPLALLAAPAGPVEVQKQPVNVTAIVMFMIFVAMTMGITYWAASRTKTAKDFYTGGGGITGFQNGLAIAGEVTPADEHAADVSHAGLTLFVLAFLTEDQCIGVIEVTDPGDRADALGFLEDGDLVAPRHEGVQDGVLVLEGEPAQGLVRRASYRFPDKHHGPARLDKDRRRSFGQQFSSEWLGILAVGEPIARQIDPLSREIRQFEEVDIICHRRPSKAV